MDYGDTQKNKQFFFKHILWYMSGAAVPIFVKLIKNPIFTRHFSAHDFGILGLVLITYTYLSTLSFSWLSNCIWRYYHRFKEDKKLPVLYANITFFYTLATGALAIFTVILCCIYGKDSLYLKLILLAFAHFSIKEIIGLYLIVVRLKNQVKRYNLIISTQVLSSFLVLLFLTFGLNEDISAMILNFILIDSLLLFYIFFSEAKQKHLNFFKKKFINNSTLKKLLHFGGISLLANFFLLLIISSDRYVIALFHPVRDVGVYTKTYDIAHIGISALIFIFFSSIKPTLNRLLETSPKESSLFIIKYLNAYLLLLLPIVFLGSLFARDIVTLLLGKAFWQGYPLIPYIFLSIFTYGIITFFEIRYEFQKKVKQIALFFGCGFLLNLSLNLLLIPYDYQWAATTTLLSYCLILSLFLFQDRFFIFKKAINTSGFLKMLFSLGLIGLTHFIIKNQLPSHILISITEILLFSSLLYFTLKKDVKKLNLPLLG